jgi:hypothetical protein
VKIQNGGFTIRKVKYPVSFRNPPDFIKKGAPVYIRHTRGSRFRYEIEGPARSVPAEVPTPDTSGGPDAILAGLAVVPAATPWLGVAVRTGAMRFSNVTSDFVVAQMNEDMRLRAEKYPSGTLYSTTKTASNYFVMKVGQGSKVGNTYAYIPMAASPTGENYRYDLLEVGDDLVIDYSEGVEASGIAADPPDVQAGHKVLAFISRYPGQTAIYAEDIDRNIGADVDIVILSFVVEDDTLAWSETSTDITITAYDLYGNTKSGIAIRSEIYHGNGAVSPSQVITNFNGVSVFTYFRGQGDHDDPTPDVSPLIKFTAPNENAEIYIAIALYDSLGNPMD